LHFELLVRDGRRAFRAGEHQSAALLLRQAVDLWRGEALYDAADTPFALAARTRLEELRLGAIEDRIEADMIGGQVAADLVAELGELTLVHPLRERLRALHIAALQASGRQAEALTAYQQFRRLLSDELGADPGPDLQEIHLAMLRSHGPPRELLRGQRGNIRAPLTRFVGRAEEQERLRACLAQGRLVSLVGPGGAGKTRLATAAAVALGDTVPGGVWLVELATVTDPADVPRAVVGALCLRDRGLVDAAASPRSAVSRIVEAMSATAALVIIDNCEHVVEAAAILAEELLGHCPRLRIVATSREPLDVVGETLVPVRPLAFPGPGSTADEAMAWPAVQLFADRAAAVQPDFRITDQNVATVLEICRRLDGLPLAIELAAAKLRSLPLEQLAAGLDDRFRLLTGGSRTAVPRHRTLRAVVEWSWDLLTEEERTMAQWLAMFPATIVPESAARLVEPSSAVPSAVFNTLSRLVDKSLLQLVDAPRPRYRMLETIREYIVERLADDGQIAAMREQHRDFFLRLAETAAPHLRGPEQRPWLARLAVEQDNLLAAVHFAMDTADAGTAVRLGAALSMFWTIHGDRAEATTWLRRVLDMPGEVSGEARLTCAAGYLLNLTLQGGYVGAKVSIPPGSGHEARHPVAALLVPALALIEDDVAALAEEERRPEHPDPWTRAVTRLLRAFLRANHGQLDSALDDFTAAVEGFRAVGERWGLATSLTWLANVRTVQEDPAGAVAALEESIRLLRELDPDDDGVVQRVWVAVARSQQGDAAQARAELLDLVSRIRETPSARYVVFAQFSLGDIARHAGDLDEAARWYDQASKDLDLVPFHAAPFQAMINCANAHLALARGDLSTAEHLTVEAFETAVPAGDMPVVALVAVAIAWLQWHHRDARAAAAVLGAAHALRGSPGRVNADVAGLTELLRNELGQRQYEAAYGGGRVSDRAAALALLGSYLPAEPNPALSGTARRRRAVDRDGVSGAPP
jgi:predicted ATPase/tetratricopeptide (TPR) repeat protein